MTASLMFQGTGSDVGKSVLVAGLCRLFARRGLSVRPFKPQNMSNNAAVTADGGEIGRAQALQARACGVAPAIDMNPVLLKPESDLGAQVIVQGQRWATLKARDYSARKPELLQAVLESYHRLGEEADLVLVEGAGSPAEVNLRAGDIANMGFAEAADCPVILIGDIDRGGVIASLVGTHAVIRKEERARIRGFLINKFRGDTSLFNDGMDLIAQQTGWPALGVVPFLPQAGYLPAEDAVSLSQSSSGDAERRIHIVVPRFSRIANFDDFDPLAQEPDVLLEFVEPGRALPGTADLVILPGSKSTLGDLAFFREQGWDIDLRAHLRRGGWVLGICGGYQMLGRRLHDPDALESGGGSHEGLGLLEVETTMKPDKTLVEMRGRHLLSGLPVLGYEMHLGHTEGPGTQAPFLQLEPARSDGAVSADGRVMGCYLHGLFQADDFRSAYLGSLCQRANSGLAYEIQVDNALDALADHLEVHVDADRLLEIATSADVG
ncbi:cobyric acid synthase [Fodinicurvata sediminis]|uniref:cobyric acid synthase n=1 Tax=Fodinicurvata sediminis TaxID=1121832 RepID=UPI0003B69533|nr:cobyric acid synthase [Fodinicurvata sediminis]